MEIDRYEQLPPHWQEYAKQKIYTSAKLYIELPLHTTQIHSPGQKVTDCFLFKQRPITN